jgi:RNA ligase
MSITKIKEFNIPVISSIEPFNSLKQLVEYTKTLENAEGFIVAFSDGHKIKIKADQYVRIHKALDRVRFDRNIVALILHEEIDDVVPLMPATEVSRIRDFENRFWKAFKQKENQLYGLRIAAQQTYGDDRKRIAVNFVPTLQNKADASFIFRMLDGHDIRQLLLEYIEKNINTNVRWEACAKLLGM